MDVLLLLAGRNLAQCSVGEADVDELLEFRRRAGRVQHLMVLPVLVEQFGERRGRLRAGRCASVARISLRPCMPGSTVPVVFVVRQDVQVDVAGQVLLAGEDEQQILLELPESLLAQVGLFARHVVADEFQVVDAADGRAN